MAIEKKGVTFFTANREEIEDPMVKSLLNGKTTSNITFFSHTSAFKTPIKAKPSSVKVNNPSIVSNNGPSDFVLA
jgi:hypothetical protein